ncbi:uncharacterized protein PHACADRAFT_258876 [Phanerochaete carnosa HHB-10118-sp]|uniref:Uncharacterized protein n=1 Tax=Phanerochaete carnosa (strain HHB-10118-sp) TaxID=650164 RepID=K5W771_PHACS|nr:uncharacterized protein PHACADRAFT_258876 [Phanerochaete carnosa HHB-10118-sp]EKM54784.1 hypothetical protein PHACADRAFT_258876 [Phanerochaete carnosa HHB-10118-sp]
MTECCGERDQPAPPPSDSVKDVSGIRIALCGAQATVHGGRPINNYGPPPAPFHPAFAMFDHH